MRSMHSNAAAPDGGAFIELVRTRGEDNLAWLERARKHGGASGAAELLLLGGTGPVAFRLRVAQSHVRGDLTPSHWSHVALLDPVGDLYEISLEPAAGFGFPPPRNAVQKATLAGYRSARVFPNIAWVKLGVSAAAVQEALTRFTHSRGSFDSLEPLLAWLAFVWGVGTAGNPLIAGMGVPAAAMVEAVVGAAGYELTPGLASRSSCPEAVWQTVRWWQNYYQKLKVPPPSGYWTASHFLVDEYDAPLVAGEAAVPSPAARGKRSAKRPRAGRN